MLPNVLALDAPLVAVVWQWFLARQFSIPLPFVCCAVLALATWSVYLVDRCLDAARGAVGTARHAFAARHARLLLPLGMVSGVAAVACTPGVASGALGSGSAGAFVWTFEQMRLNRWVPATFELPDGSAV